MDRLPALIGWLWAESKRGRHHFFAGPGDALDIDSLCGTQRIGPTRQRRLRRRIVTTKNACKTCLERSQKLPDNG